MVLESTIVCVDNSEFSRNGDFPPSRLAAQSDAVNLICTTKIDSHPENTVGLLTSAGKSARILVTSTQDVGRILAALHDVKFDGTSNLLAAVQKAQLALKHRQNQAQRQRIVLFVSSPVTADTEGLVKLGKKLKKNNVAVDVINVGEEEYTIKKIDTFIEAVNSNNNSHALHVQAGPQLLADLLMSSDIMVDRETAAASGGGESGGGNASEFPFGVDPNVDPDLAMVLRISAEEERARQEARRQAAEAANGDNNNASVSGDAAGNADDATGSGATGTVDTALTDDVDLYGTEEKMEVDKAGPTGETKEPEAPEDDDEEMDESMRAAIALSKEDYKEEEKDKK